MSCQPPHWPRRNVSPASNKQGPVRATVPVSLMRQNPGSPTKTTHKKESPLMSISSKALKESTKKEKSKTLNLRSQPQEHCIRRTASLDAIYITSQWQPNAIFLGYCGQLMIDKATQTPVEWNEEDRRKLQRKPIVSSGDQLEVKFIRQKLQRTNQNSRMLSSLLNAQSPVQGDHSAISASNSHFAASSSVSISHSCSHHSPPNANSSPIPIIHSHKVIVPRMHNSVEGLNQEIEKLVMKDNLGQEKDIGRRQFLEPTPEGHRAPIAELFHSTPGSGTASRSHSISPAVPVIPGNSEFSVSPHIADDTENTHKLGTSPHINQFLVRGPPDGCEKVKIVEEPRMRAFSELTPTSSLKPKVLLPSQSSAFCPLFKELKSSNPQCDSFNLFISSTDCHH